jgi:Raf kinase inhibitor-like YbhB/YbcL family protein
MQLTSPAFAPGAHIPAAHTCKGSGTAPALAVDGVPNGAKSLALIVHDPDAPAGDFVHWTLWNLPAETTAFGENPLPDGTLEGGNDFGSIGYGAPCPPSGTHHYVFELYALDDVIGELNAGASRAMLEQAMQGHVLAQAQLIGLASA